MLVLHIPAAISTYWNWKNIDWGISERKSKLENKVENIPGESRLKDTVSLQQHSFLQLSQFQGLTYPLHYFIPPLLAH